MLRAIKIIERLLTQSEYHEAHVLYKDYPSADVKKASREEEDKANEKDQGRKMPAEKVTAYTDFRELLAKEDIDAVTISTPDHCHAIIAIASCRSLCD